MHNINIFLYISFIVIFCSLANISCGVNIFSDSDDIKLGKQMDEEIRKKPKEYPILQEHPEIKQYVMEVGNKVLASPYIEKRGIYAYKYEIIHDDSTINAFCTPGGYIYVYTGLLRFIDNEATLAGVMGHEIAHAERRHATKRISNYYGWQIVLSIALGQSPSKVAEITANLFTGITFLANSRSDETEADEFSMKYLSSTPYYPGAITNFFEKMQEKKGGKGGGAFQRLLSTHPLDQDRIDHVNQLLTIMGNPKPTQENLFADRYQSFKKKLP
ncbi:MAG: M48 family metalloprotease [Ignavibacteriae bacterium]|nr:M48 family metalloprotease [Ignavibacteriota bacterium]